MVVGIKVVMVMEWEKKGYKTKQERKTENKKQNPEPRTQNPDSLTAEDPEDPQDPKKPEARSLRSQDPDSGFSTHMQYAVHAVCTVHLPLCLSLTYIIDFSRPPGTPGTPYSLQARSLLVGSVGSLRVKSQDVFESSMVDCD
ncbi:unnamed protein product [Ambrosiozyma monospora]|uniref:Unnamed protein product n=1 Tax=Ambrosiozyma monospora TaxID=43982 RepID=A0A9W6WLY4_AMBMO|nr:unnamed protein product [Ambrosiozyma monospora]